MHLHGASASWELTLPEGEVDGVPPRGRNRPFPIQGGQRSAAGPGAAVPFPALPPIPAVRPQSVAGAEAGGVGWGS